MNTTLSVSTAWVPTTSPARPSAMAARATRFSAAFMPPTSKVTLTPNGSRRSARLAACWRARISVGASMALCQPFCAANQMAAAATSVLPLPTSPCSRQFIGVWPHRSADFFRRAALCPGGCIGQAAPERRKVQLPHGGAGNFAAMAPHQKYAQLQDIQFFKDQTAAGGSGVRRIRRGMDGPHSVRFGWHAVAGQQLWRQRVIQLGHIFQRQLGAAGQAGGGQPSVLP